MITQEQAQELMRRIALHVKARTSWPPEAWKQSEPGMERTREALDNFIHDITLREPAQDPTKRMYDMVPIHGWSAETPDEMFAVLSQLMWWLNVNKDGDGAQLLARLWRVNSPLLAKIARLP